ncbi:WD40 repeat domain-containing protein [Actinomadura sp. HBU206391]|uniref:WD40 repeat domain-containing protein n=1 Tax=Actinomadura sp. HBU206391 TaxID=2731692 RepID=UPI0016504141|nr:hypothetical protein [Actinomadura sp. HBU206391]MBC6461900.1 hypothetical protein [Actinomadura sp. HBU206391]
MDRSAPAPRLVRLPEPPLIDLITPLVTAKSVGGPLEALVVLPDGDTCVADTGRLDVVSLSTGETVRQVCVSDYGVGTMALAGGSRLVTTGGFALQVWDTDRWIVTKHLADLDRTVTGIAAAGDVVVTGGWNGARVWDLAAGSCRFELPDAGEVTAVAVTADGSHAITLNHDDRVVVWELKNGTAVRTLRAADPRIAPVDWNRKVDWEHEPPLDELARSTVLVDPGTDRVFVAKGGIASGPIADRLRPWGAAVDHPAKVMALRPSDGVVAVGDDESVRLFDRDGGLIGVLGPTFTPVRALAFAPDGRLVCGLAIGQIEVWSSDLDPHWSHRQAHTKPVWRTSTDRTGRYGMSVARGRDQETRLWDLTHGRPLIDTDLPRDISWYRPAGVASIADADPRLDSDDGTRTVTLEKASEPERGYLVSCRDLPTGTPRWSRAAERDRHRERGWYPAWMVLPPEADVVLLCTDDPTDDDPAHVTVLDLNTGRERGRFEIPDCRRPQPQVRADGSVFLRHDGPNRTVRLTRLDWRAGTTEPYAELPGRWNALVCVDGLVLTTVDNEVQLIEPETSRLVACLTLPTKLNPWSLAAGPDGRVALAGDDHGCIHIFQIEPA